MIARRTLLAGLWLLAALEAVAGLWQVLAPRSFFDLRWVSYLPPYNEHLMTDVGSFNLALALVLAGAATSSANRALVRIALSAFLVYAVSHFVFHAGHLAGFPTADAVAQTLALGVLVVLPVVLLVVEARLVSGASAAIDGVSAAIGGASRQA